MGGLAIGVTALFAAFMSFLGVRAVIDRLDIMCRPFRVSIPCVDGGIVYAIEVGLWSGVLFVVISFFEEGLDIAIAFFVAAIRRGSDRILQSIYARFGRSCSKPAPQPE